MADFLKKDVRTPLGASYIAAGMRLRIETNSEAVLAAACATLGQPDPGQGEFRLRLWIEEDECPHEGTPRPYFRGLGDLIFSGYGDRSSLLINLRDRCGAGRMTRALAASPGFWDTLFFPSVIGIVGPSFGLTSLHSACVAWRESGLLLAGGSGAGKSSLALALAREGMDFVSDDRTLISARGGTLRAWGLSGNMKQRPEAAVHFPELSDLEPRQKWEGDTAYRFDPVRLFGVHRASSCEPVWIVFLERQSRPHFALEEISPEEAILRLQSDLRQECAETAAEQRQTIEALSQGACYILRYGGSPRATAGALCHLFVGNRQPRAGVSASGGRRPVRMAPPDDPLRRFRATCLRAGALLMGRHLRIETDSPAVLAHVSRLFSLPEPGDAPPQFVWRIVSEPALEPGLAWPSMTAFSDRTLRYVSLGQRSFLAVDLGARTGVGLLPESLCEDPTGFSTVFLAGMLHLTAPALGLTPVSAACVARGRRALLLFGPPNSGKTTASYWASKLGLDFHADQATFLELDDGAVRAWGDFWPAAFRPETARFLPELSALGRSFTYRDRSFLCVDKAPPTAANRVTPAACIFLERHAASPPRLVPLSSGEIARQVFTDSGSSEEHQTIVRLLGQLPAYRLLYDDDPYVAALLFRSVLDAEQLMEQRV